MGDLALPWRVIGAMVASLLVMSALYQWATGLPAVQCFLADGVLLVELARQRPNA
jgi:hypothetical protein